MVRVELAEETSFKVFFFRKQNHGKTGLVKFNTFDLTLFADDCFLQQRKNKPQQKKEKKNVSFQRIIFYLGSPELNKVQQSFGVFP